MQLNSVTAQRRPRSTSATWTIITLVLTLSLLFSAALDKAFSPLGDTVIHALQKRETAPVSAHKNPANLSDSAALKNTTLRAAQ
jgi:hypothetical protein